MTGGFAEAMLDYCCSRNSADASQRLQEPSNIECKERQACTIEALGHINLDPNPENLSDSEEDACSLIFAWPLHFAHELPPLLS